MFEKGVTIFKSDERIIIRINLYLLGKKPDGLLEIQFKHATFNSMIFWNQEYFNQIRTYFGNYF